MKSLPKNMTSLRKVQIEKSLWHDFTPMEDHSWVASAFRGRGDLYFKGVLRFSGSWVGSMESDDEQAHLHILKGARFSGTIKAATVTIEGRVDDASLEAQKVNIKKGATFRGKLSSRSLVIDEGALVQAQICYLNGQG